MVRIVRGMRAEPYKEDAASGFMVDEQSLIMIRGRFVQKITLTEKVVDPLGNEFEYPLIQFIQQEFAICARPAHIMLLNPSTASRALTGRLAEFSDFNISVEPIAFDPDRCLKSFASRFDGVRVYAATIEDLPISSDTTARISFQSSGSLEPQARAFLKNRRFKFSSLRFSFLFGEQMRRCEIKASGTVILHGEYDPALRGAVIDLVQPFLQALPS